MKDRSVILIAAVVLALTLVWYAMPLPPDDAPMVPAKAAPGPVTAPVAQPAPTVVTPVAPPAETPKQ